MGSSVVPSGYRMSTARVFAMAVDPALYSIVRSHGTRYVWHYTPCAALPSIVPSGAIYSRAELLRRGISFDGTHYYGSGRHEEVLGEYVSGAPLPPWGMMQFETEEIVLLQLHPAVLAIEGTCYCPGWSPRGDFDPDEIVTWTGPDRLEALYSGSGPLMIMPCEFFVPTSIPLTAVQGIVFFNRRSMEAAVPALEEAAAGGDGDQTIGVWVNAARFPRRWQEAGPPWEVDDGPTL